MALSKKEQTAFNSLKAAIEGSESKYIFAAPASVAKFVAEGLVETNDSLNDGNGNIAVRLKSAPASTQTQGAATVSQTNATPFAIEDGIELPTSGRGRTSTTYPFDLLNVGQSFFVANTAEKPNAAKSLASTVSSATARYAEVVPGQTKKNKAGEDVPVTKTTRKFVVRAVEGGARVWRTA